MSVKTFGRPLEEENIEFGRVIDWASPAKEVVKQSLVGGAKGGLGSYGDILDLLNIQTKESLPGEKIRHQQEIEALNRVGQNNSKPTLYDFLSLSEDDIAPSYSRLPSAEDIGNFMEMLGIETEPKTTAGKYAHRIGETIGSAASLGGTGKALSILGLGAGVGEGVEQATDSPTAGLVAELLTTLGSGGLRKKLAPTSSKGKELVEQGRKIGLTEEELTPLLQGEKKLATFSKLAKKTNKTSQTFKKINEKLGDAYDLIREQFSKHGALSSSQNEKLLKEFGKINKKLRTTLKASPEKEGAIKYIEESMENLRNRGTNPSELIGFWGDINNAVNWNAVKGGKKSIAALKQPIREVLQEINPQLAKDFELTNNLYSKYKKVSKALKPDMIDKWLNKGEAAAIVTSLATGNPILLKGVATESAIRILSKELLTNPRLQNVSNKALQSIRQNKGAAGTQVLKTAKHILEKKYPEEEWDFLDSSIED